MSLLIRSMVVALVLAGGAQARPQPAEAAGAPDARTLRLHRGPMFGAVSPEGRQILGEAMRAVTREDRAALVAARDRINALVAADKLDLRAVGQAMEAERRMVDAGHAKRQAALLAALPRLSQEDRQAFAEDARTGRDNMEARAAQWRKRLEANRARMGDARPQ